jgi:hypothetical protein
MQQNHVTRIACDDAHDFSIAANRTVELRANRRFGNGQE